MVRRRPPPAPPAAPARVVAGPPSLERRISAAMVDPAGALAALDKADCETSFPFFVRRFWHVLEPARPCVWNWHLDAVGDHLVAITEDKFKRLLINIPPGMMKSLMFVFWTAWEWGPRDLAHVRLVNFSYAQSLTLRDNRKLRRLVGHPEYQALWGDRVQVNPNLDRSDLFELLRTGFSLATSIGGVGTGERGDRVKVDDPHNVKGAESEAIRSSTVDWFAESLTTRMIDPRSSSIIVIMQRVHEKDVSGHILEKDLGYEHLMLPMEYEPRRCCYSAVRRAGVEPTYARYLGTRQTWLEEGWRPWTPEDSRLLPEYRSARTQEVWRQDRRSEEGELLAKERFPANVVADDRKAMGEYAVVGQLQQRPAPRGGLMFKREAFVVVRAVPTGCRWVRHWDLAATRERVLGRGARTAGVLLGLAPSGRYVVADLQAFMVEDPRPLVKQVALSDDAQYGRVHVSIPKDPGAGGKLAAGDYVTTLDGHDVAAQSETGDKVVRAEPFAAQCNAGNVDVVVGTWNPEFFEEISKFPAGSRKDVVDSLSGGYMYLRGQESTGEAFSMGIRGHG